MSRVKLGMLSLLAVLALSAAASATASATTHQWIIGGTPLAEKATQEFQGNNLPYAQEGQLEATLGSVHIYCQTALLPSGKENLLEGGNVGKAKVRIEFTGCGVFTISGGSSVPLPECKFEKEPIVATAEGELKEAGILTLKPVAGSKETFATFKIVKTNKEAVCAVEVEAVVKGGVQACVLPHPASEVYVHVLECTPGGSSLTLAGEPARLYLGTGVTLEKGGKFCSS